MHHQNSERAWAERQKLNNELNPNKRDEQKMEPKKNLRGQALLSADTALPGDEQFTGKGKMGRKKQMADAHRHLKDICLKHQCSKQNTPVLHRFTMTTGDGEMPGAHMAT